MADHVFPLEALCEEVKGILADAGNGHVPHFFGASQKHINHVPPKYVWVPTRIADRNETPTSSVDEFRTLFSFADHVQVYCHGRSFAEMHALRRNIAIALHNAAYADVAIESGQYVLPGTNIIQSGQAFVFEFSIRVPIPDEFVTIADVLTEPEVATFVPTEITGDIHVSSDPETDGELGVSVSTSP